MTEHEEIQNKLDALILKKVELEKRMPSHSASISMIQELEHLTFNPNGNHML